MKYSNYTIILPPVFYGRETFPHSQGRIQIKSVEEQDAEENI